MKHDRHAAVLASPATHPCGPADGREMQAVNSVVESQILAKLTYYKYYNNRAGFSLPSSLQQSIGVWRKRQALSTSSTGQPDS